MLKLLTGAGILIGCGLVGWIKADRLRERLKVLRDLRTCLTNLKMHISYAAPSLSQGLRQSVFQGCNRDITCLFAAVAQRMDAMEGTGKQIWEEEMETIRQEKGALSLLSTEEVETLRNFISLLGATDLQTQYENFDYTLTMLNRFIEALEPEVCSKGKMYRTMGILAGLMIFIVLM